MVLPMNTGAEAVESGIKVARKWGYEVKGVPDGRAVIIVASGNFHGRTTTIISFSDDPLAHAGVAALLNSRDELEQHGAVADTAGLESAGKQVDALLNQLRGSQ